MKTLIAYVALTTLVLTSSFTIDAQQKLNAQSTQGFGYFRVHRMGKSVSLSWAVATPDAVQFVIERSYDGDYFEPVGSVDNNGGSAYKFNDNTIFPGTLYYRVRAVNADASSECTSVQTVRIVQRG
jgi:hypothetical protein